MVVAAKHFFSYSSSLFKNVTSSVTFVLSVWRLVDRGRLITGRRAGKTRWGCGGGIIAGGLSNCWSSCRGIILWLSSEQRLYSVDGRARPFVLLIIQITKIEKKLKTWYNYNLYVHIFQKRNALLFVFSVYLFVEIFPSGSIRTSAVRRRAMLSRPRLPDFAVSEGLMLLAIVVVP